MTATIDTQKNQQAVQIIAAEIAKIPANTMMDYGTLGREVYNSTKRQGEAKSMALYFVDRLYGKANFDSTDDFVNLVDQIAKSAVEITGI